MSEILDNAPKGLIPLLFKNYIIISSLFLFIKYYNLDFFNTMGVMNIFLVANSIYHKRTIQQLLISFIKMNIFMTILFFIKTKLLFYGIIGYLIFILLFAIWRIYKQWDLYAWGVLSITHDIQKIRGKVNPKLVDAKDKYKEKIEVKNDKRRKDKTSSKNVNIS